MYVNLRQQAAQALQPPVQGLGWFWTDWYTVWNGKKWLASRKITASAATTWQLDEMEKNWNQHVRLYKHDGKSWRQV